MSDARKPPIISAVLTVYNKARFLHETIRSLRRQAEDERAVEYVFVDDASSDDSVSIIKELTVDAPHIRVIENSENSGPSVRLNQAAAAATGDFLYFLDGDDIATDGAMMGMLRLLEREQADFVYGKTVKRPAANVDLFAIRADSDMPYSVSENPLETLLYGGFVRMALMCRRDLFMAAGGADECIFVQDESLPLRLAAKAKRMIEWQATVIAMPPPPADGGLKVSANKRQLHHDAFLAYRHALDDFCDSHPHLTPKLYAKAVSAYWKHARRRRGAAIFKPGFWRYLQANCVGASPCPDVLDWMAAELSELPGVRRL